MALGHRALQHYRLRRLAPRGGACSSGRTGGGLPQGQGCLHCSQRSRTGCGVSETILSAENITVVFSGVCAVEDVSFSLHESELLGVVGPNGSGKTSLLNSLCGV